MIKRSVCDHSSLSCPHNFSFHALPLYFLCDMSYNSSHLRTFFSSSSSLLVGRWPVYSSASLHLFVGRPRFSSLQGFRHVLSLLVGRLPSSICVRSIQFFSFVPTMLCFGSHMIYAPILLIFHPFLKTNQAGLIASKHSKRSGDDVITAHMIRIEHVGPVPSRQTFSLGGGDGTELRCSCQCEHLRLITHEKSLLNGDVPRRNGNVT